MGLELASRRVFFLESILNQFYFWDRISRALYLAQTTMSCAKAVLSGTQFFFGLKKNEKSASGRRKKNILKIKFSKKKLRKIFFSTSLTTFLRWNMAENARGAQYQPCRDVTFFDFDWNRAQIHVEISRKSSITFSFFVSGAKKSLILLPLTCPSRPCA